MNNKGFSLVELIIVIAIMAILIVVLAPQYLKYVEKSRNSTDLQSATEFKDAMEIWAADPDAGTTAVDFTPNVAFKKGDTFSIVVTATGNTGMSDACKSALANSGLAEGKLKCTSKTRWSTFTLNGKVLDSGAIEWTYASDGDFATAMGQAAAAGGTP